MKKKFIAALAGCIALVGSFKSAQAQDLAFTNKAPNIADRATLEAIISEPIASTAKPLEHVKSKVARLFDKYYKNAQNVQWYNNGKGYIALFDEAGMKARVFFGKDGYWYYDVHFGSEKNLPTAVRKAIKSNYVDYNIGPATEVNVNNQNAWFVNIEDADNLIVVRYIDGSLDEWKYFKTHSNADKKELPTKY